MNRRDFVRSACCVSAGFVLPSFHAPAHAATSTDWRTFEVTTRIEVLKFSGVTRVWAPAALLVDTPFQRTLANRCHAEGGTARVVRTRVDGLGIASAEFPAGVKPVLTLTSRVATRNYTVDPAAPSRAVLPARAELEHFLRPTRLLPTDGIVRATAAKITSGVSTDSAKARAIYEWIVDNTFRDPKTRGCGIGDIRFMLESGDLGGKCADLNALFVGLARAAGLPARDVYGIRLAPSALGYKSLGAATENVTRAQHCRAEVYLAGCGWMPVDPADVRKVALEEPPGNRAMEDQMVRQARARLFGSWEMNWMAYNVAHDVALPGSSGSPVGFLMYPQAETAGGRLDSLAPDAFRYEIASHELASANG